ncbi:uncharacterized protein LOC122655431 [Telopea speciosissima]|uniref:uncharacterized protein LOC122655431 n=1 Tax=Telopea speciosissima TaxID=54955 RepID=UPI001CC5B9D7|nr:uncharacterized protein LOC122655431 [Telopea speciosissima]
MTLCSRFSERGRFGPLLLESTHDEEEFCLEREVEGAKGGQNRFYFSRSFHGGKQNKVKVREEKEEDDEFFVPEDESFVQEVTCSLPLFRILESVSLQEHSSVPGVSSVIHSGKESQNDSSPSVARIPDEATTSISISKGVKNCKEIVEDIRIRASSIPRPRAVISSPDNDWMIGSRNRLPRERSSNLKKNNLGQKSPNQVKDKCIRASGQSSDHKSCLNETKAPELKVPKQKTFLRKGKPGSMVV